MPYGGCVSCMGLVPPPGLHLVIHRLLGDMTLPANSYSKAQLLCWDEAMANYHNPKNLFRCRGMRGPAGGITTLRHAQVHARGITQIGAHACAGIVGESVEAHRITKRCLTTHARSLTHKHTHMHTHTHAHIIPQRHTSYPRNRAHSVATAPC